MTTSSYDTRHDVTRRVRGVNDLAVGAARSAYEAGGSPRAQLDAARGAAGKKIGYMPHAGSREAARNLRRLQNQQEKA
jgi:hypothetical protein